MHSLSVVPFKSQVNSFEWARYFKDFTGSKYRIESQHLFLEEITEGVLDIIKQFLTKVHIPFTLDETSKILSFDKIISLPRITKEIFIELVRQYYTFHVSPDLQSYCSFISHLISDMCSHIRIISGPSNTLRMLVEGLKHEMPFQEAEPFYKVLLEDNEWKNLIIDQNYSIFIKSVSINTWLHVLRHPNLAKDNLLKFLQYLSSISVKFPFISTDIPLVEPKNHFMFSLTYIDKAIFLPTEDKSENDELNEIVSYWLIFGSLVLRNINYALIRFTNLSLEGFTHEDIEFYEYFKPKLTIFSESCYNPDLVNAFKDYNAPRHKMFSSIRGHDLYTYNRSSILEFHLKQAQQEFSRFPAKKILRKRVNRRSNKLYTFLNDIIYIYKDYLNEISNLTKASGNYTSIEKIIKNDKYLS